MAKLMISYIFLLSPTLAADTRIVRCSPKTGGWHSLHVDCLLLVFVVVAIVVVVVVGPVVRTRRWVTMKLPGQDHPTYDRLYIHVYPNINCLVWGSDGSQLRSMASMMPEWWRPNIPTRRRVAWWTWTPLSVPDPRKRSGSFVGRCLSTQLSTGICPCRSDLVGAFAGISDGTNTSWATSHVLEDLVSRATCFPNRFGEFSDWVGKSWSAQGMRHQDGIDHPIQMDHELSGGSN